MWSESTHEEFESIPGKPAPKPNQWDELLTAVAEGMVVRIPVDDGNKLKGVRIGIGRRAKSRQIPIETRARETTLFIRRKGERDASSVSPATAEQVAPEQVNAAATYAELEPEPASASPTPSRSARGRSGSRKKTGP